MDVLGATVRAAGKGEAVWVLGDLYTFKAVGKDTDGRYELIEAVIYAGNGPPPHRHTREAEAFYILKGEIQFTLDGKVIAAKAGDFVHSPPGIVHAFKNIGSETATMLISVFPATLENFFKAIGTAARERDAPPAVTQADIERAMVEAPKYGLEMMPPG